MIEHIEFKFKGSRNYIHGTDMLNKSIDLVLSKPNDKVDFRIIKMSDNNLILTNENVLKEQKDFIATIIFDNNEVKEKYFFVEATKAIGRYDYDEDSNAKLAGKDLNQKTIELSNCELKYTNIEIIVALTKALHNKIIDNRTKWVFVGFTSNLELLRVKIEKIKIRLMKNFNNKLTINEIIINEQLIGQIKFSSK